MKSMELQQTIEDLKAGDRLALSKFLTHVEISENPIELVLKLYNKADRTTPIIGVTGFPGAGKSSLINSFISILRSKEKKIGVIAVDPSSLISGGSLLGDRTRMEQHSSDDNVFIRSLSSDGALGGISHKSFLLSLVMATFNFDFIFVETVGVGQSESDITKLADFSILTLAPGLGDSIQAMKGGVLEIVDLILVNKSDKPESAQTFNQLKSKLPAGIDANLIWDTTAISKASINNVRDTVIIAIFCVILITALFCKISLEIFKLRSSVSTTPGTNLSQAGINASNLSEINTLLTYSFNLFLRSGW